MKRLLLLAVFAVAFALFGVTPEAECSGCGLRPLKPLRPLGCRDLVLQCVCNEDANNCQWTWVCVK